MSSHPATSAADVLVVAMDGCARVELVNRAFCELMGLSSGSDLLGRDWFETCCPNRSRFDARAAFDHLVRAARPNAAVVEETVQTRGGGVRIVSWTRLAIGPGTAEHATVWSVGRDVTEQRAADHHVEPVHLWNAALRALAVPAFQTDAEGRFCGLNEAFARLLGRSASQILGRTTAECVPVDFAEAQGRALRALMQDGGVETYEVEAAPHGHAARLAVHVMALTDAQGNPSGAVGVLWTPAGSLRSAPPAGWDPEEHTVLGEIPMALISAQTVEEIAGLVVQRCKRLTTSVLGRLGYVDPTTGRLISFAGGAPDDETNGLDPGFEAAWERLAEEHPVGSLPPHGHGGWKQPGGLASGVLAAPSLLRGDLVGWLAVARPRRPYDSKDRAIVRRLAAAFALAVDRKRADDSRRAGEEQLRTIVSSAAVAVFRAEPASAAPLLQANPALARLFGFDSVGDVLGVSFESLCDNKEDLAELMSTAAREGVVRGREVRMRRSDGATFWASVTAVATRSADTSLRWIDGTIEDVTERREREDWLRELSFRDELTGLYNRRGLLAMAAQMLRTAKRQSVPVLLLYADLDGLKGINDRLGHLEGDRAIQDTASVLNRMVRDCDIVARLGGDEFVLLAMGAGPRHATILVDRIRRAVSDHNQAAGRAYLLSLSIGSALCDPDDSQWFANALAHADAAMYDSKRTRDR